MLLQNFFGSVYLFSFIHFFSFHIHFSYFLPDVLCILKNVELEVDSVLHNMMILLNSRCSECEGTEMY